jgi:SAM-dependent methyltransferase
MIRTCCPICGSSEKMEMFERDFSGMREIVPFLKYTVYACKKCGMVYAGDISESMTLSQYYDICSKYTDNNYYLSTSSSKRFEMISGLFEKEIDKDASILEIGCAEGFLLDMLLKRGYSNVFGIEPSSQCVSYARENLHLDVVEGGLGNMHSLGQKKFDVIVLEQVLEHIEDSKDAILEMNDHLTENGKICIGVPDAGAFKENIDFYRQFSSEHINYFSEGSITNLMNSCGFEKIKVLRNDSEKTFITLWKRTGCIKDIRFDRLGVETVETYISKNELYTEKLREKVNKSLANLSEKDKKFYIWGGGTFTATLVQMQLIDPLDILAVIDTNRNFHGHKIFGKTIISPEYIKNDNPILISVYGNAVNSIRSYIQKKCISNRIIYIDI